MVHPLYKVVWLKVVSPYTLEIGFDDQKKQIINFESVLYGEMYAPLRDPSVFNRVVIDPEIHTIVWPNGADFDPVILHDWGNYSHELVQRAQEWDSVMNHIGGQTNP